jgi:hypothetical protein
VFSWVFLWENFDSTEYMFFLHLCDILHILLTSSTSNGWSTHIWIYWVINKHFISFLQSLWQTWIKGLEWSGVEWSGILLILNFSFLHVTAFWRRHFSATPVIQLSWESIHTCLFPPLKDTFWIMSNLESTQYTSCVNISTVKSRGLLIPEVTIGCHPVPSRNAFPILGYWP